MLRDRREVLMEDALFGVVIPNRRKERVTVLIRIIDVYQQFT